MKVENGILMPFGKLENLSTKFLIECKEYFEKELKVKYDVPIETIYLPDNIRAVDKWQRREKLELYNELTNNIEQINKELEKRKTTKNKQGEIENERN